MKVWNQKHEHRFAHVKRDGWNIEVWKREGQLRFYPRNNLKDYGLGPLLGMDLSFLPLDPLQAIVAEMKNGLVGRAELWVPGHDGSKVINAYKHQSTDLRLDFFMFMGGHGAGVDQLNAWLHSVGLGLMPVFQDYTVEMLQSVVDTEEDIEGFVMKDTQFDEGVKFKPFKDADLRITGVNPGKGRHAGRIGALICSDLQDVERANVSGMTDAERDEMTALHSEGQLLGRMIEVKYQHVGAGGRYRHCTFIRYRDDLPSSNVSLR